MECKGCSKQLCKQNKTGLCRSCGAKDPERRKRNSEGVTSAHRANPEKWKGIIRGVGKLSGVCSKEWRKEHEAQWVKIIQNTTKAHTEKYPKGSFKGKHHSDEAKAKIATCRTQWLKVPDNRKNLGRGKKSHMEIYFEDWLNRNQIRGWEAEKHFWNDKLGKNYFPDFCFEELKLIIELDGTQHRNTIEKDRIRDEWFQHQGYSVKRIPVIEFKKGNWEKELLEKLGDQNV